MKISFYVIGNVQAVMFRKTFCFGAKKRKLLAGATNHHLERNKVLCSVCGERDIVNTFLQDLTGRKLNSWGAFVDSIELLEEFVEIAKHEYDSDSLEPKLLNKDIEYYL